MSRFLEALSRRVLLFDGAMGTSIHKFNLTIEEDYLGKENCTEVINVTRPEVVQEIHESFLKVGVDSVETNTFGANKLVFAEFDWVDRTREINKTAAEIARAACDKHSTPDQPRFVTGSMGPGTKLLSLGHTDWDSMFDSYREQALGLLDGGADLLLIETCQDPLQTKCAINACLAALESKGKGPEDVPIFCSVTIETTGTMLVGTEISSAATALRQFPIAGLGLNCATGPAEMGEHLQWLAKNWDRHITVMPNAGLPTLQDGQTVYPLGPKEFAEHVARFIREFGVSAAGGCCGTTPEHLRQLAEEVGGERQHEHQKEPWKPSVSSLYQSAELKQDNSFLIVGERTNANGSRKFKRLLEEENWDGLVSMGREQLRDGSHVIDVCVDFVGRDGVKDMHEVISRFVRQVPCPLMIDSTEADVIEAALKLAGGKCIVNSINLEDGEERFDKVCPMLKTYGAAAVALTIDEDQQAGMAKTADRKLEIAERMHRLYTEKWGLRSEDLIFDPLTFTICTGNEADRKLGLETLDGIEMISKKFPECGILLGVSNVSFGLKPVARHVLNSAFLHEAVQRGLTGAIVHASKILPRNRIDDRHWEVALDLIYDRRRKGYDPLTEYIKLFEDVSAADNKVALETLEIEERLQRHIIDGERENLEQNLEEALEKYSPLQIINDHLLAGMKVVGELFGSGQMQLPFVLESAEVMKKAVGYLEPKMDKLESSGSKAKIVLATVRGDVHDIGKNLVDIILSNNGFEVINIGIKQPVANIIRAFREHEADAIGLSGLLVKSVTVMEENLHEFNAQGIDPPLTLGGAALNRQYAEGRLRGIYNGSLFFGKDAFEGLRIMNALAEGRLDEVNAEVDERVVKMNARHEADEAKKKAKAESAAAEADADAEAAAEEEPAGTVATVAVGGGASGNAIAAVAATTAPAAKKNGASKSAKGGGVAEVELRPTGCCGTGSDNAGASSVDAPAMGGGSDAHKSTDPQEAAKPATAVTAERSEVANELAEIPKPPFWGDRVVGEDELNLDDIYQYINTVALFRGQWGFKRGKMSKEEYDRSIREKAEVVFERLKNRMRDERELQPALVYGWYPCQSDGDDLVIYEPPADGRFEARQNGNGSGNGSVRFPETTELREIERFSFPRQPDRKRLCISDFFRSKESGEVDVIGFFICTMGSRVSEVARELFEKNEYTEYLYVHGVGVETAEALAERWHQKMRQEAGFADDDAREMRKLFGQKYRGSRYSFGYPACPEMSDQEKMWRLLRPDRIGCELTENWQIDPEQSVSAIVVHHPRAKYFSV
ncbi:MAG: methionine synthase [Planctomycetota bacterium]